MTDNLKNNPVEGIDFYYDEINGTKYKVFTAKKLLDKGYCCGNFCRHCPYPKKNLKTK